MKIFITTLLIGLLFSSLIHAGSIETSQLSKINSIAKYHHSASQYFAATNEGLFVSDDGHSWTRSINNSMPATLVSATGDGELYAFVLTQGLLKYNRSNKKWLPLNNNFGSQVLLDISVDEKDPGKLIALNQFNKLIISENSGLNWHGINGNYQATSEQQQRGQSLYKNKCQSCHGENGVGENYTLQGLADDKFIKAPALDHSEHAWHHTDEALAKTILDGSPRTRRMLAWKQNGVSAENAKDLVAYIKSLWTQRELDCQGPKHMQCMK